MKKQHDNYKPFSIIAFFIIFLFCQTSSFAQNHAAMRTKTNINDNWLYLENHTPNLTEAQKAPNWNTINLPHSWNGEDATDLNPGYRRDASWYQKKLNIV